MSTSEEASESMDSGTESGDSIDNRAIIYGDSDTESNDESHHDSPGASRKRRHEWLQFDTLTSRIQQQHPLKASDKEFILDVVKKLPGAPLLVMTASTIIRWLCFLWASYCHCRQSRLPVPILFISPLVALIEKMGILFQKQDSLKVQCLYEGTEIWQIMTEVKYGRVDVLLLTPEMLENVLHCTSYELPQVSFACIDNAECVVELQVYRHTYLRLNKLLGRLGVEYLLVLSALATESTLTSVKKQFKLIQRCHSLVIPRKSHLSVNDSCNKDEELIELCKVMNQKCPLGMIVICDSGDKVKHVSEMLQACLSSSATQTESAEVTDAETNRKRQRSGGYPKTIKRCKRITVEQYVRTMSLSDRKRVSDSFERNEIAVVVTTPTLCMGLPTADVIIYYTIPRTYESLVKAVYQVPRKWRQGFVIVLLDEQEEEHLEKFRCSTMDIPTSRIIEKQVKEIFEGEFEKAKGISKECLAFILGFLESAGHLELAKPISGCCYLKEGYDHPDQVQLMKMSATIREELVNQAKSRVKVYKQLYTELSSSDNDLENRIARKFKLSASVDQPEQVNTKPGKQKRVTTTAQGSKSPLQQQPLQDSSAAESQMDGCSQSTTNNTLGENELVDIMGYLHKLDKSQLTNLGLVLGLSFHRVNGLMDSASFLSGLVLSWLSRADQVATKSGVPTWRSLVKALRHKLLGQTGIANEIATEKNLE